MSTTFGITMTSELLGFSAEQYHFVCVVCRGDNKLATEFHMGSAHKGRKPRLVELLSSLQLDSRAGEGSFEDYCSEFGEDNDSRRAERTWKACAETRRQLQDLLVDGFEDFMSTDFEADEADNIRLSFVVSYADCSRLATGYLGNIPDTTDVLIALQDDSWTATYCRNDDSWDVETTWDIESSDVAKLLAVATSI